MNDIRPNERQHENVQLPSGRIVRAQVLSQQDGCLPLVSWGGMTPFFAEQLTQDDILWVEANDGKPLPPLNERTAQ